MRPPYMTATRCATSATTPRSWVIRTTAAPVSRWRRASSASTCACTVTSSAVVGSSAMMTLGRPAIAMAITARWRIPPENWNGYCRARLPGSAMSTSRSSSTARVRALRRRQAAMGDLALDDLPSDRQERIQRRRRVLEDDPDVLPAHAAQRLGVRADDLLARRGGSIRPRAALSGSSPAAASAVTLLPDPDSPTMPSTSFSNTSRSMPRTAGMGAPDPTNVTASDRMDRTGSAHRAAPVSAGWHASLLEARRPQHEHVVHVEREAGHVLGGDDDALVVGVGRECRRPSRPAPC